MVFAVLIYYFWRKDELCWKVLVCIGIPTVIVLLLNLVKYDLSLDIIELGKRNEVCGLLLLFFLML